MNLGDLKKDKKIKALINHLSDKYGEDKFKIKDNWEGDLCAIGFIDLTERYLVYVSTFEENSNYYVALENPSKDDEFPYEPAGDFNDIGLKDLEEIFVKHLKLK